MKTIITTTLALALLSAAGITSAETIKFSVKDAYAGAAWSTSDECSYTSVDVSGHETVSRQTSVSSTTSGFVSASYQSINWCTGEMNEGYAYGEGQVDLANNRATIKASLTSFDYFKGESGAIDVDLTIVADGESIGKSVWRNTTTAGPVRTMTRQVGSYQSATATGTIAVNGVNIIGTNSIWGGLGRSNSGTIEIYKPALLK